MSSAPKSEQGQTSAFSALNIPFADRVQGVKPSPTLALNARAKKMQAEGIDVVNLTCGEPDFPTPSHICDAAKAAIDEGFTKYTATDGIPALKDAVARAIQREQGLKYDRSELIITPGAKYAILASMQALLSPGDEVLIPVPYWVSYFDQVKLSDGNPVLLQTSEETGLKITPDQIDKGVSNRSKMLILNSPSNPSGVVYTEEELKGIAEACVRNNLIVISDEIYDSIVYGGFRCMSIAALEGMRERTIIINGASKKFAMTGWRMGFAAAPKELIAKMSMIQGQAVSNVTSITQKASIAAYDGDQTVVDRMVAEFEKRRRYMVERLNGMNGVRCASPAGAFYAFPNVTGQSRGSADLAEYLLDSAHVATVPGEAFGMPGYLRLSFATSMENIIKGMDRMERALG